MTTINIVYVVNKEATNLPMSYEGHYTELNTKLTYRRHLKLITKFISYAAFRFLHYTKFMYFISYVITLYFAHKYINKLALLKKS